MKKLNFILLFAVSVLRVDAQTESYRGGAADGYSLFNLINYAAGPTVNPSSPYSGGRADGHTSDSLLTFPQRGYISAYQPYSGGQADGWAGTLVTGIVVVVVPVELLSFTGEQLAAKHLLRWATSQESNSEKFIVERSRDGITFGSIGSVRAAGNSTVVKDYQLTDGQPLKGNNFYRLKFYDTDGSFTYSNVILLKQTDTKGMIAIYPNPASNIMNVSFANANSAAKMSLEIFDNSGRLIKAIGVQPGRSSVVIDVSAIPKGVYSLRIQNNDEISTLRFIRE